MNNLCSNSNQDLNTLRNIEKYLNNIIEKKHPRTKETKVEFQKTLKKVVSNHNTTAGASSSRDNSFTIQLQTDEQTSIVSTSFSHIESSSPVAVTMNHDGTKKIKEDANKAALERIVKKCETNKKKTVRLTDGKKFMSKNNPTSSSSSNTSLSSLNYMELRTLNLNVFKKQNNKNKRIQTDKQQKAIQNLTKKLKNSSLLNKKCQTTSYDEEEEEDLDDEKLKTKRKIKFSKPKSTKVAAAKSNSTETIITLDTNTNTNLNDNNNNNHNVASSSSSISLMDFEPMKTHKYMNNSKNKNTNATAASETRHLIQKLKIPNKKAIVEKKLKKALDNSLTNSKRLKTNNNEKKATKLTHCPRQQSHSHRCYDQDSDDSDDRGDKRCSILNIFNCFTV